MIDHVEVDWRDEHLAVRDQGARPTCLAHAATAAHEHTRGAVAHLSPEYLHFFARGSSTGSSMDDVAEALKVEGQSEEVDCPYLPQDPPAGWKPPAGLTVFRRGSEPKNATAAAVESWIRACVTPVLGLSLPESFYNPTAPWVISPTGSVRGLHAVVAVGLGRHQGDRVFLIRNSWGADWGDGGYAWLSNAFFARHLKEALLFTDEASP
jgi:papain like protease